MPLRPRYHHSVFDYLAKLVWCAIVLVARCKGVAYDDVLQLFNDKLGPNSSYNANIRPMFNHSNAMTVHVEFHAIAIVEIDAVSHKFLLNGFLTLSWTDEILAWETHQYNGVFVIYPKPVQIWRPRLILLNTVNKRAIFDDSYSPLKVFFTGWTRWAPGELFPASCKLDLYKYPFDVEECAIIMVSFSETRHELKFKLKKRHVGMSLFANNGEWIVQSTKLKAFKTGPHFEIIFKLKRRPGFFIVNIVIPIVLMSFLNILVFIIPVDSGEKISYGITVLLALTVFMSIVSGQLPRSSDPIPAVTIYLLILNIISLCTVMVSIVIVLCHHKGEGEVKKEKVATCFKSLLHRLKLVNHEAESLSIQAQAKDDTPTAERRFSDLSSMKDGDNIFNLPEELEGNSDTLSSEPTQKDQPEEHRSNKWKTIGRRLDYISIIVFPLLWIAVTIIFLKEIAG